MCCFVSSPLRLSSIEEFAQFAKMIDSNMSPIRQSCLDMSSRSGGMLTHSQVLLSMCVLSEYHYTSIQYRPSVYRLPLIFVHSDMSNTLQQLGKDLSRFTRGEEPATQTLPQSQKKTSSSSTHHRHYRSAAELEEDREPVVGDWAWQGNKRCVHCILSPTHSAHLRFSHVCSVCT